MRLRVFRAPSVAAAMAQVRQDLGPEALILGSRRVPDGVEVTAAVEPAAGPPVPPLPDESLGAALRWHGVPRDLADRLGCKPLADVLAFRPLDLTAGAPPLLLAGPPGAGKTLTTARLATRLVMAGMAPLVITADGKRAGATEQLAAFTRLLGLTLIVAHQPAQLSKALARREAGAPVLIDGAGLDPFDKAQQDELRSLAAASDATVALVLPAGLDPAESGDLARAFQDLGVQSLVATRLDLARRVGSIVVAAASGLALSEAGVGPGAADGLVPFTPALLAQCLQAPAVALPLEDA